MLLPLPSIPSPSEAATNSNLYLEIASLFRSQKRERKASGSTLDFHLSEGVQTTHQTQITNAEVRVR
jgi:hypothetical protein